MKIRIRIRIYIYTTRFLEEDNRRQVGTGKLLGKAELVRCIHLGRKANGRCLAVDSGKTMDLESEPLEPRAQNPDR